MPNVKIFWQVRVSTGELICVIQMVNLAVHVMHIIVGRIQDWVVMIIAIVGNMIARLSEVGKQILIVDDD